MCGWLSAAIARASRANRWRACASLTSVDGSTFIATVRSRRESCALYTSPMPPAPIGAVISYGPSRVPSLNNIDVNWGASAPPEPARCVEPRWGSRELAAVLKFTARHALATEHRVRGPPCNRPSLAGVRCSSRMSRRRAASLAVLLAALLFRLGLALALANDEPDDGRLYALIGHNVLAHGVYSASTEAPYTPTYIRVPGYPLFLAATYALFGDGNNTAVRAVQALVDTATCWLVGLVAMAWAPRDWLPAARDHLQIGALAIAAACPFPAIYVATILTETLAMFLGTLAVLLTSRALRGTVGLAPSSGLQAPGRVSAPTGSEAQGLGRELGQAPEPGARSLEPILIRAWLAAGAAAGATALVRPEFILYAGAAGIALLVAGARDLPFAPRTRAGAWMSRIVPSGLALTLGVILVLAPWTIRNLRTIGAFQPLNPRSLAMPGEFVAYGYADWVRTWIDHPRYVAPTLFTVDLAPISIETMPPSAFDSAAERNRVAALLAVTTSRPPTRIPTRRAVCRRAE